MVPADKTMSTNKQQDPDWLNSLRALYKEALCYDWDSNVRKLNERYNLTGQRELSLQVAGLPPAWFNGDVESIEPGRWVMAVSLNPHVAPEGYYGTQTGKTWWPYWLRFNIKHWYPRFFRPLVQVAAMGLGEQVSKEEASRFACERMVFLEVCPYTSGKFDLSTDTVRTLLEEDRGFSIAKQVRQLLLSEAKPALVLVNGNAAIGQFEEASGASLTWEQVSLRVGEQAKPNRSGTVKAALTLAHVKFQSSGFLFCVRRRHTTHQSRYTSLGPESATSLRIRRKVRVANLPVLTVSCTSRS